MWSLPTRALKSARIMSLSDLYRRDGTFRSSKNLSFTSLGLVIMGAQALISVTSFFGEREAGNHQASCQLIDQYKLDTKKQHLPCVACLVHGQSRRTYSRQTALSVILPLLERSCQVFFFTTGNTVTQYNLSHGRVLNIAFLPFPGR